MAPGRNPTKTKENKSQKVLPGSWDLMGWDGLGDKSLLEHTRVEQESQQSRTMEQESQWRRTTEQESQWSRTMEQESQWGRTTEQNSYGAGIPMEKESQRSRNPNGAGIPMEQDTRRCPSITGSRDGAPTSQRPIPVPVSMRDGDRTHSQLWEQRDGQRIPDPILAPARINISHVGATHTFPSV